MIPLGIPGIPNGWILEKGIWRGGQPVGKEPFVELRNRGCALVVDLDSTGTQIRDQGLLVQAAGIPNFYPASWNGILPPRPNQVEAALGILDSYANQGPAFIHCQHGSDRTGTLCAIWRMHHDNWSFEDSMEEAFTSLGLNGMHEFWFAAAVAEYAHARKEGKR